MRTGVYPHASIGARRLVVVLVVGIALLLAAVSLLERIEPSAHPFPF